MKQGSMTRTFLVTGPAGGLGGSLASHELDGSLWRAASNA
jgi:hypothetical protein